MDLGPLSSLGMLPQKTILARCKLKCVNVAQIMSYIISNMISYEENNNKK